MKYVKHYSNSISIYVCYAYSTRLTHKVLLSTSADDQVIKCDQELRLFEKILRVANCQAG